MKQLQELAAIVTRKKLMKLSIVGQSDDSKLDLFYNLIVDKKVSNDHEAAQILYNETADYGPYKKLKKKLEDRLAKMLFLIDTNQNINGNGNIAHEEAWRLWANANLMLLKGLFQPSIKYTIKALKLAIKFEHIDLVVKILKVLRKIYATSFGDTEKFEHYNQLYQKYEEASRVEAKVEEYYERLMLLLIHKKSNEQKIAQMGESFFLELAPYLEQHSAFTIHRFIRYIQISYLTMQGKYQATIIACDEALAFFKSKDFKLENTLIGFLLHQLVCHTQLKQFEAGEQKLHECLTVIGGSRNLTFFKIKEKGLMLFLHNQQYQKAYATTAEIMQHKRLERMNKATQETWRIYNAYIHYLIFIGKIETDPKQEKFNKFRMGKFLNEIPIFSKDKRGMNIPILILQILFYIAQGKYNETFEKIDAIERYASRYIKKDQHFRSNCFIKMLLLIPKQGFHKNAVIRHTKKLHQKLTSIPLHIANQSYEIEIIPYEDLWQMAIDSLQLKYFHSKKI